MLSGRHFVLISRAALVAPEPVLWEKCRGGAQAGEHQRVSQDNWGEVGQKVPPSGPPREPWSWSRQQPGLLSQDGSWKFPEAWKVQATSSLTMRHCPELHVFVTTALCLTLFAWQRLKKEISCHFFQIPVLWSPIHKGKPWKNGYWLVFFWQMIYFPNKSFFKCQRYSRWI